MSNRIEDLDPAIQASARTFLSLIPVPYVVTSTLRTAQEQVARFAQGRAKLAVVNALRSMAGLSPIGDADNAITVTNCDGVTTKSNHQGGRALDVVPEGVNGNPVWPPGNDLRWPMIAKAGKAAGFTWGGDWPTFPDLPHYEK